MTASRPRRSVDHLKPYQFKPGQSGNPKGGNHLQTLRAQLANLDEDVLDWLRRLFRRDRVSNTALDAVRLFLSLRYPEEWRAATAAPAPNQQPVTINAGTIPATPETQELKRVMIEALMAHVKQKEVGNGATQPPALPNLRVMPPATPAQPAAAVENGHSSSSSVTLPPTDLPFGNWK